MVTSAGSSVVARSPLIAVAAFFLRLPLLQIPLCLNNSFSLPRLTAGVFLFRQLSFFPNVPFSDRFHSHDTQFDPWRPNDEHK